MNKIVVCAFLSAVLIFVVLGDLVYAQPQVPVLQGIDRLFTQRYLSNINDKKIAVVANSVSLNREGRSILDLLKQYPRTQVVAVFTPEHGFDVSEDDKVADDGSAKIPFYSLYGPRKSPSAEQLEGVDVIVFDLETVGLRYYTYITTLALVMKSAKENNIPIVVLDRVNPLGGQRVSGAMLAQKYIGDFAGYYPIPTRYGLTMGELAKFYNRYFRIGANLTVVPLKNWHRNMLFVDTQLKWHAPSPALLTFEQAFLYGIFGPFESLQLAVGRSQTNREAFKRFGAPWISDKEAVTLVKELNNLKLTGFAFKKIDWVPNRAKYQNEKCHGFEVEVTALKKVNAMMSFLKVSEVLYAQFGHKLRFSGMDGMIGSAEVRKAMENRVEASRIVERIMLENKIFMRQRQAILLY